MAKMYKKILFYYFVGDGEKYREGYYFGECFVSDNIRKM